MKAELENRKDLIKVDVCNIFCRSLIYQDFPLHLWHFCWVGVFEHLSYLLFYLLDPDPSGTWCGPWIRIRIIMFLYCKKIKKWIRFSKIFWLYLQHTTMFISCPPPYYSIPTRITRITVIYAIDNSTCRYLRASPLGDLRGGRSHCEYKALVGVWEKKMLLTYNIDIL